MLPKTIIKHFINNQHTKLLPEEAEKSLILAPMCKLTLNNSEVKDHVTTNDLTLEQTANQVDFKFCSLFNQSNKNRI